MLTYRTGVGGEPSAARFMADHLLEATIPPDQLRQFAYYNGLPTPRTDDVCAAEIGDTISPRAAAALGLATARDSLSREDITNLLCGYRADGQQIVGKQYQARSRSLADMLDLATEILPDDETLRRLATCLERETTQDTDPARSKAARQIFNFYHVPPDHVPDGALCERLGAGVDWNGEKLNARKVLDALTARRTRIGYIDLTWSADKSVSIAWALARSNAERALILQAHRDAVSSAMGAIETLIGRARKGKAGAGGVEPGHIGWIRFEHFTARPTLEIQQDDPETGETITRPMTLKVPGDPQLHTHVIVPNMVVTDSGRVGGLDLDRLGGRIKEHGALYQAFLARNLRKIGIDVILDPATGAARLPQVSDAVRDAFSKRTTRGEDAARAHATSMGRDWDTLSPEQRVGLLKQSVQGDARQPKQDDMADEEAWRETARTIGWEVPLFICEREAHPPGRAKTWLEDAHRIAGALLAQRFEKTAVLGGTELRHCAALSLTATGIEELSDLDAVMRELRSRPLTLDNQQTTLICVEDLDRRGEPRLKSTTGLHIDRESELIALAQAASTDRDGALDEAAIDAAVSTSGLDFTTAHGRLQRQAMSALATQGRLSVLIGVAGSGKTTLLAPLVQAWRRDGRQVFGTAVAWRQAEDLAGAGIDSDHRLACTGFLHKVQSGTIRLDANAVVVLDELSLLSTAQLLALLQAQRDSGCRLILIGDPKQCQAVEAGPVVDLLRRAMGQEAVPELISSVRQQTEHERATALMWRDGKADEALDRKDSDGTLILAPGSYPEVVGRIADFWRDRWRAGAQREGFSLTVSAPTNADARAIAREIRMRRRILGQLGADLIAIDAVDQHGARYPMQLAKGDRVRLYARTNARCDDGRRGVIGNNGSVLEVLDANEKDLRVRTMEGRTGLIAWTTLTPKGENRILLGYGDVLSIDATQGVTSTEHIEAMPNGSHAVDAHRAYTQGSRHRETTWLVTSEAAERRQIAGSRALGDNRPIRKWDILANMARNMTRADPRESALALLDRARDACKASRAVLQETRLKIERAKQAGAAPSLQPAIARHRRRLVLASQGDVQRELGSGIAMPVLTVDLGARIRDAVARAFKVFGDRLPGWIASRRRKIAREHARARLQRGGSARWKRIRPSLPDFEIPQRVTSEYFAALGFNTPEDRCTEEAAEAFEALRKVLWRKADTRRDEPIGVARAEAHVDRLLRLTSALAHQHARHGPEHHELEIDLRLTGRPDAVLVERLPEDLREMGIEVAYPDGRQGQRVTMFRKSLIKGLADFDDETVEAVCDRLLLADYATRQARRSIEIARQRGRTPDQASAQDREPPPRQLRGRDGLGL